MCARASKSSPVVLGLALSALAVAPSLARAQDAEPDWSLPDPFHEPAPTSASTPERVVAPAEQTALARPLVLQSVVVYGTSTRRPFEMPPLRSPSLRPRHPSHPPPPAPPPVVRTEPARPRVAAIDPVPFVPRDPDPPPALRARPDTPRVGTDLSPVPARPSLAERAIAVDATPVVPMRRPIVDMPGDPPDALVLRSLSPDACFERLRAAGTPFDRLDPAEHEGVEQPARLRGPLAGVTFRPYGTASARDSVHQIVDCRLALAMLRAAAVFRAHGIREVRYFSIFRPGARVRSGSRAGRPSLHSHALAIDVPFLVRDDGTTLGVERDWGPAPIGAPVCGPDAVVGTTDASAALRALACDLHARRAFQMILTPQYDRAHFNHFHIQLDPHETRLSVR